MHPLAALRTLESPVTTGTGCNYLTRNRMEMLRNDGRNFEIAMLEIRLAENGLCRRSSPSSGDLWRAWRGRSGCRLHCERRIGGFV